MIARFLAWLRSWATRASSSADRRTSIPDMAPEQADELYKLALDAHRRFWEDVGPMPTVLPPGGSSSNGAPPVSNPTTTTPPASTALPTMPAISGSSRPISAGQHAAIQHNPHSGRIDASSRKQFGMCDYPDIRHNGKRARDPGVDTGSPSA